MHISGLSPMVCSCCLSAAYLWPVMHISGLYNFMSSMVVVSPV